jgi:UDP-N-acetylglucosamine acyltransferase
MLIHPTAIVDPQADIHPTVSLGPHVVIEGAVRIAAGCKLGPGAFILGNTEIGANCVIHAHAVLGDLPQDKAYTGETSFLKIGSGCVFREGATAHRGTGAGSTTVIGNNCMFMTNSHIGHNCTIADDVMLVSGALVGGHCRIGRRAVISGGAAVHQFVRIGDIAVVAGMSLVTQDVPPFAMTDRAGCVVGINFVGMRRAGMSIEERNEIKQALHVIYRSGMNHQAVLAALDEKMRTSAGRRLLEFLQPTSKRGIAKSVERRRAA